MQLQHPYRGYSLLFGLVVLTEAGYLADGRCREALDLLESKRLPDAGFPAERRTYRTVHEIATRGEFVDWGPHGKTQSNEFVTADALYVLKEAGRLARGK